MQSLPAQPGACVEKLPTVIVNGPAARGGSTVGSRVPGATTGRVGAAPALPEAPPSAPPELLFPDPPAAPPAPAPPAVMGEPPSLPEAPPVSDGKPPRPAAPESAGAPPVRAAEPPFAVAPPLEEADATNRASSPSQPIRRSPSAMTTVQPQCRDTVVVIATVPARAQPGAPDSSHPPKRRVFLAASRMARSRKTPTGLSPVLWSRRCRRAGSAR